MAVGAWLCFPANKHLCIIKPIIAKRAEKAIGHFHIMYKKFYENSQFYTAQGKFYVDKRAIPCYNKLLCEITQLSLPFA